MDDYWGSENLDNISSFYCFCFVSRVTVERPKDEGGLPHPMKANIKFQSVLKCIKFPEKTCS